NPPKGGDAKPWAYRDPPGSPSVARPPKGHQQTVVLIAPVALPAYSERGEETMLLPNFLRGLFAPVTRREPAKNKPAVEHLENRITPYSVTGDVWAHPELVTISFMPDGTPMSSAAGSTLTSNLLS